MAGCLPECLCTQIFDVQNGCHAQVAPSFFDAPGAQDSNQANAGITASPSALPVAPAVTLATAQQLSDHLPNITFAFASEVGYKVS